MATNAYFLRVSLLIFSFGNAIAAVVGNPTAALCDTYNLPSESDSLFHGDHVCDRSQYNALKENLGRGHTYRRLKTNNEFARVPNEKTVICPLQVEDLVQGDQNSHGFDSVWIVENTSIEAVVLSFIGKDGVEYSASNPTITPPQSDPQAFLNPKQWRAVYAWEGHVFHARSFDAETGTLGPVLLQHRMGLIPVGANAQQLECPADDPEPMIRMAEEEQPQLDPRFKRTTPTVNRRCNAMDIGFRNMANCPLNGYFIGKDSNRTICQEQFKFHLGLNPLPMDFMWQWDSQTKFEQSFVGHSFAFRSAANPSILVDTVTLQPTRVTDCPELKTKTQVNKVTTVGEPKHIFLSITDDGEVSKHDQLIDSITRMERRVMEKVLNVTYSMNATVTGGRRVRSRPLRENGRPYAGISSF
ncbi:hypothetical protein ACA910_015294 [Epithemia clementina (nom. ined.)]